MGCALRAPDVGDEDDTSVDESAIFAAALEKADPTERARFLETACAGNTALRARVDALLGAYQDPDSLLDRPLTPAALNELPPHEAEPGQSLGPYKLLQKIGEGGMGVVFMAEQSEPVKRRVALKIVKPGMDTREVIARFEAERQALAMMDHPGIATVLDAGTTPSGRPYFVMELVHGLPITEYCDEHHLSTGKRLELFAAVCRAVQHAHQKGIIHRDLKPSNILVAEYDQEAVPKVIDFGVAKATSQQLTEKTLFTQFGQIIGTLDYMSPEQAKRNQLDVDTRSDIYSMGIVLYELLTGETPFDKERLRSAAFDEMLKIIREEDPPRPSQKLSDSRSLHQVAANRGVEPQRLASLVHGDLDWIVMKTLAKDRGERYASANELAEDVVRHLRQQPISAGPPRPLTYLVKFARRHRAAVTAAAVAVLAVTVGILWSMNAQRSAEARITGRSQRAAEALNAASLALGQAIASPLGGEAEWVAADLSRQRLGDLQDEGEVAPEVAARILAFTRRFGEAQAERQLAQQIEEVVITGASHPDLASWEQMERNLRELFLDHGFDLDQDDPADVARRIREDPRAGRWSDALDLWIATRGQMSTIGGPELNAAIMQPWAEAMYAADPDPVRTGIRRLIYSARPFDRGQVDVLVDGVDLSTLSPRTLSWLAGVYGMAGAADELDRIFALTLRLHPGDVMVNFDYAYLLDGQGRWQEAVRMYMRALALRPETAGIWQTMGLALVKLEEFENARQALERACELEPDYAPSWVNLGNVLLQLDQGSDAEEAGRRAEDLEPESPGAHGVIGRALMAQGHHSEALDALQSCHELGSQDPSWREPSASWVKQCQDLLDAANKEDH